MMYRQKDCTMCPLSKTRTQVVISDGGLRACDYVIVGEAPGEQEDKLGRPFVGKTGKLLRKHFKKHGLILGDDAIVLNTISCRPPNNKIPTTKNLRLQYELCHKWLHRNIAIIQPKYICLVGKWAALAFLPEKEVSERGIFMPKKYLRTKWQDENWFDFSVFHIYHPSYITRQHDKKLTDVWSQHIEKFCKRGEQ